MERDKLIEILENGSEAELMLIQNYLLDKIIKKMPTEAEAIQRCVETSEKIKYIEEKIENLEVRINSLEVATHYGGSTSTTWTYPRTSWSGNTTGTASGTISNSSITLV